MPIAIWFALRVTLLFYVTTFKLVPSLSEILSFTVWNIFSAGFIQMKLVLECLLMFKGPFSIQLIPCLALAEFCAFYAMRLGLNQSVSH